MKRALAASAKWVALLILFGCGKHKPAAAAPTSAEQSRYAELVARLPQFYDDGGWVVSRGANTNQGDSLLFTGLAMYALPCDAGATPADAIATQLATGAPVRYPGNTDAVSFDGLLGMLRGITARVTRCGEASRWAPLLRTAKLDGLPVGFDYVRAKVLAKLGLSGEPDAAWDAKMEAEAASFAGGAVTARAGCFRVHLALLALQTTEELGGTVSTLGRDAFCAATRGARIETVEHYCGRSDLTSYLDGFQENVWIYQHQRCPAFETPDAAGAQEPGLDYLVAYLDKTTGA